MNPQIEPPALEDRPDAALWEIERKFLVATLPDEMARYPRASIRQGYLAIDVQGFSVRLRAMSGRFIQTIKQGQGLQRREVEIELTPTQFEILWPLTAARRIEKQRYMIPYEGHTIELDVYAGALEGFLTAEVEFDTVALARSFTSPAWFGRDVTEDLRYTNQSLSIHGLPQDHAAS